MSPTASLDRAGQDATSGVRPSGGASMGSGSDDRPTDNISIDFGRIDDKTSGAQGQGSGGDDRPSENISIDFGRIDDKTISAQGQGSGGDDRPSENISLNFGRIDDKTSDAQGQGSSGADDFVLEPGTAGAEGSSGLLDFSNIDDRGLAEAEESLAVDSASELPSGGDSATVSTFEAAYADPTGDRIEDIVTAPRPLADDFIA